MTPSICQITFSQLFFGGILLVTVTRATPDGFFFLRSVQEIFDTPPPEAFMDSPQLIKHYNYTVETHYVPTEDGFILQMFRISRGPSGKKKSSADLDPIILQHGLLCSSDDWLLLPPKEILPFMFADKGYDVWLGNCRGNNYSQKNLHNTPDQLDYWDFSFHEMGKYDIPAIINYVLRHTRKEQLNYVGHSMGTTMFFVAMDQYPELQGKIRKMIALSPVAYISHVKTPAAALALTQTSWMSAVFNWFFGDFFRFLQNDGRIFPDHINRLLKSYAPYLCAGRFPASMCENVFFFMTGYNPDQTSNFTASMVTGHTPSDASGKTLNHFLQWVLTPNFQQFDYGSENFRHYNQSTPPLYNLSANNVETLVMYADNDWLVVPEDALKACNELGNAACVEVTDKNFNHLDFTYAKNAREVVYEHCIKFIQEPSTTLKERGS